MKTNLILLLVFALILIGCKAKTDVKTSKKTAVITAEAKLFSVGIGLPFESSNYNETNFELFDMNGKLLNAFIDTVTKTGGHIEYSLPKGKYRYSIKTVFDETITKQITIISDSSFSFYRACYSEVDVIDKYQLADSKVIKLLIVYDFFDDIKAEVEIEKMNHHYLVKTGKTINGEWKNSNPIDSAIFIDNFSNFESIIIGNRDVKNVDEYLKNDYMNSSKVYVKADESFLQVVGVKTAILEKAFDELMGIIR